MAAAGLGVADGRPGDPALSEEWARAPWQQRSTREVYRNPWIRVREDIAELPDGHTTLYGVVECPPCIGVLPLLDDDTVVMVGQYRYVFGEFLWEMPTGGMRPGEAEEAAVQRELAEEAGYRAGRLTKLCTFHTSKSILHEIAHLYLARDLAAVPRTPDETEFIDVRAFPFAEVLRMVERSEIKDAMTVIAVLHAARGRR
jgi:ADP-ribose diphosphatase